MKQHAEMRAWKAALAWWLRERTTVSLMVENQNVTL
jgi:hypothetical protein